MDRLYIAVITLHLSIVAKNILLKRSHNYGVWNYWQQKLLYCICYTIWINWHMIFGLEQEGGSLIAPMALAYHLQPIGNRSRNRRRNMWVDDVFPPDDLCSRPEALCCDAWCRGLTTCLLHVGPPFGNRFLNTSWAVGLTYWIVYLHFLYFDICNYICLDTSCHFGYPTKMLSRLIPGCQLQHRNRKKSSVP